MRAAMMRTTQRESHPAKTAAVSTCGVNPFGGTGGRAEEGKACCSGSIVHGISRKQSGRGTPINRWQFKDCACTAQGVAGNKWSTTLDPPLPPKPPYGLSRLATSFIRSPGSIRSFSERCRMPRRHTCRSALSNREM